MEHRVFVSEDEAAQFIARIKALDPYDDFIYVISTDPLDSRQFIIEIFAPDGRHIGRV